MKRVFVGETLADVGLLKQLLEHEGLDCYVRNEQLGGALGEVPFLECMPELWVLRNDDAERATALIAAAQAPVAANPWTCASCGERHEAQYAACWRCGVGDANS
jgi:hypothetical protein